MKRLIRAVSVISACFAAFVATLARGADDVRVQPDKRTAQALIERILPVDLSKSVPFSLIYGGRRSNDCFAGDNKHPAWTTAAGIIGANAETRITLNYRSWTDPESGLRVGCELTRYIDFPAAEWFLTFENTGSADTPIIEDVQALDVDIPPNGNSTSYRLHRTNGAPANPTDYESSVRPIDATHTVELGGGKGRSSNRDFPFFKIEANDPSVPTTSLIVAVGWSGQWHAKIDSPQPNHLHLQSGLELTHFRLHPHEKVRSPRILMLAWSGDTLESNAQFRQLIYKHYAARRNGDAPQPVLFCNTCFTRGGGWLNECNEQNQISLINAYAPLGLEALITDAGWFEGGWPSGAGNWTPRKDAYPHGMAPVAAAAKAHGMAYGLWFEPERVVAHTDFEKQHPAWVLRASPNEKQHLADFGRPEVQDYFFQIVKGFMDLPGFRFYRQDFNTDPLPYWRANDAPDRQGITEMHYIEGLYAYWDHIRTTWPDSYREECASGGRRIDLETVMRMPLHQDSDHWFDDDTNQAATWGLSQYLPNSVITMPVNRLDDYSFRSAMASSLCMGWIADAKDFDAARGKHLLDRYRELRHLLVGAWYPLLPYSRKPEDWMAYQFHRPDLNEGMVLAFRHAKSPTDVMKLQLHGLDPKATYELRFEDDGQTKNFSGDELSKGLTVRLPEPHSSALIVYHRVKP